MLKLLTSLEGSERVKVAEIWEEGITRGYDEMESYVFGNFIIYT